MATATEKTTSKKTTSNASNGFEIAGTSELPRKPLDPAGEYEGNPIGLPREVEEPLIAEMDRHLAAYSAMWHLYHKHHWLVKGPQFYQLHLFLERNYEEVAKDADLIAERITAIGGVPTSAMANQAKLSYVAEEPEGYFPIRPSLRHDMHAERAICQNLRKTIVRATAGGDFGTETLLKAILLRAEDRAHHLEHFLGDDSLEEGREGEEEA